MGAYSKNEYAPYYRNFAKNATFGGGLWRTGGVLKLIFFLTKPYRMLTDFLNCKFPLTKGAYSKMSTPPTIEISLKTPILVAYYFVCVIKL